MVSHNKKPLFPLLLYRHFLTPAINQGVLLFHLYKSEEFYVKKLSKIDLYHIPKGEKTSYLPVQKKA